MVGQQNEAELIRKAQKEVIAKVTGMLKRMTEDEKRKIHRFTDI